MSISDTVAACEALMERHIPRLTRIYGDGQVDSTPASRKKYRGDLTAQEKQEILEAYAGPEAGADIADRYDMSIYTLRNLASAAGVKKGRPM